MNKVGDLQHEYKFSLIQKFTPPWKWQNCYIPCASKVDLVQIFMWFWAWKYCNTGH